MERKRVQWISYRKTNFSTFDKQIISSREKLIINSFGLRVTGDNVCTAASIFCCYCLAPHFILSPTSHLLVHPHHSYHSRIVRHLNATNFHFVLVKGDNICFSFTRVVFDTHDTQPHSIIKKQLRYIKNYCNFLYIAEVWIGLTGFLGHYPGFWVRDNLGMTWNVIFPRGFGSKGRSDGLNYPVFWSEPLNRRELA